MLRSRRTMKPLLCRRTWVVRSLWATRLARPSASYRHRRRVDGRALVGQSNVQMRFSDHRSCWDCHRRLGHLLQVLSGETHYGVIHTVSYRRAADGARQVMTSPDGVTWTARLLRKPTTGGR